MAGVESDRLPRLPMAKNNVLRHGRRLGISLVVRMFAGRCVRGCAYVASRPTMADCSVFTTGRGSLCGLLAVPSEFEQSLFGLAVRPRAARVRVYDKYLTM